AVDRKLREIVNGRVRRDVAPVGECVDPGLLGCELEQRAHVVDVRMHAAVRDETQQMHVFAALERGAQDRARDDVARHGRLGRAQPEAKASTSSDAPPTRAPSTSACWSSPGALSGLHDPPYRTGTSTSDRMNACPSCAISGVAVRPVPIAHTGSYASMRLGCA